jgi:tetratricopeptide (TPR) repeat protein
MEKADSRSNWRRLVALVFASLLVLTGLVALRGPDPIGGVPAEAAGGWLLSGPSAWDPLTLLGAVAQSLLALAGPRAWQNAHVVIAWLAVVCWLRSLSSESWRGLGPLIPALLAVVLSQPESGMSGFGLAVLVLSFWDTATNGRSPKVIALTLPPAAWLAVWLSPGALLVVAAALIESWSRSPRKTAVLGLLATIAATQATPRGFGVWSEAEIFTFWSPQAVLSPPAILALLFALAILAFAAGSARRTGTMGPVLAPALLLLGALPGQTAFLWPAALWLIPCWSAAVEQWRHIGFRFRWWMQTAAILIAAGLAAWQSMDSVPRWYALAMTDAVMRPTLTRDKLPAERQIYINPRGMAVARLSGPIPGGAGTTADPRLGREPSLWRAEDRQKRYDAVWLLGDKSDYAPLARHLGESPDWRLEAVDATGVLFVRAPSRDIFATEPAQQMAREMWGGANRSGFLSGAALSSLAAGALPEAGELSASAIRNSDLSAPAAAARARVLVSLGDVRGALEQSERATLLDPTLPLAWETRSEALLHAGLTDDAYAAAQRAAALAPGDLGTLWLAARAANAARAFQTEAELLERLIALTRARGGDPGFYHLYLGQSYAKQGLARPALREFAAAAAAPGLTDAQRRELEEEMERIRTAPGAQ